MPDVSILDRVSVARPAMPRDERHFVTSCGIACELALVAADQDAALSRPAWADYHNSRAQRLAAAALFVASGGRHG